VPETVTHEKRLDVKKGAMVILEEFLEKISPLKRANKLGAILIQLSPSFSVDAFRQTESFLDAEFHIQTASGGSVTDDAANGRVAQATGTTNGAWAHISKHGVQLDFSMHSGFMFKGFATAGTFVSVRMGIAIENVNASPDNLRKYGLKACDSARIARTYDVISFDGTAEARWPRPKMLLGQPHVTTISIIGRRRT